MLKKITTLWLVLALGLAPVSGALAAAESADSGCPMQAMAGAAAAGEHDEHHHADGDRGGHSCPHCLDAGCDESGCGGDSCCALNLPASALTVTLLVSYSVPDGVRDSTPRHAPSRTSPPPLRPPV